MRKCFMLCTKKLIWIPVLSLNFNCDCDISKHTKAKTNNLQKKA
jgi:hypothetical protein